MQFKDYVTKELKESISLNENIQDYGYTTTCKAQAPFTEAHRHTYYVNSYGFGWTGPASDGYAHIHQIIDGKVVAEGDNHTHDLEPAIKRSSDAEAGVDPVRVLEDPYVGVTNTAKVSVKVKKKR